MFLGFCSDTAPIWNIGGKLLLVFKIIIPVILVILGVVALGKAVIADDEKEIKTAWQKLIKKVIAAVLIFFIPTLVFAIFSLIDYDKNGASSDSDKNDFGVCIKCLSGSSSGCTDTSQNLE